MGNFSRAPEQCRVSQPSLGQPIQDDRFEVHELFAEELLLALPPGHPLTRKRAVSATDLEGERLIVMKEGHCLGDQVLSFCHRRRNRSGRSWPFGRSNDPLVVLPANS
jgi:DNA-binding transcriptional LysR family regulator